MVLTAQAWGFIVAATLVAAVAIWAIMFLPGYIQRRKRALFERFPDAIIEIDLTGKIRFLNEAAERLFGREQRHLLGVPISGIIRSFPDPARAWTGFETIAIRKDFTPFAVRCVPLEASFVLVKDESDRDVHRATELRCELLLGAFQRINAPVFVVDGQGQVLLCNRACIAVWGGEIRPGMPFRELVPQEREHGENRLRVEIVRSGWVFTSKVVEQGPAHNHVIWIGERKGAQMPEDCANQMRLLENLLTELNVYSELLLTVVPVLDPIREDVQFVHKASQQAVAAFDEVRRRLKISERGRSRRGAS